MVVDSGRGKIPVLALIAILSISLTVNLPGLAISPIMAKLYQVFHHVTKLEVQLLTVLPNLVTIPFILYSGKICTQDNQLKVLTCGLIIYTVTGIAYFFANSMIVLILLSCLLGIGCGLVIPLAASLISQNFTGNALGATLGAKSGLSNFSVIIATLFVGWVAGKNWHLSFIVYFVPLIPLCLVPFMRNSYINKIRGNSTVVMNKLTSDAKKIADDAKIFAQESAKEADNLNQTPENENKVTEKLQTVINDAQELLTEINTRNKESIEGTTSESTANDSINKNITNDNISNKNAVINSPAKKQTVDFHFQGKKGKRMMAAAMALYLITTYAAMVISYYLPFTMDSYGLSTSKVGVATAMFYLAATLAGFGLSKVITLTGKWTLQIGLLITTAGLFGVGLIHHYGSFIIGVFLIGAGYGLVQPILYDKTPYFAPNDTKSTEYFAFLLTCNYIGISIVPFIIEFLRAILKHSSGPNFAFIINGIILGIVTLICIFHYKSFVVQAGVIPTQEMVKDDTN